jgi:hypothetical protein
MSRSAQWSASDTSTRGSWKGVVAYLQGAAKGVEQNSKEQKSPFTEEPRGIVLQVIEDTTNNKSHNTVSKHATEQDSLVSAQTLEASVNAELDLHPDADGIWRFDTSAFSH